MGVAKPYGSAPQPESVREALAIFEFQQDLERLRVLGRIPSLLGIDASSLGREDRL